MSIKEQTFYAVECDMCGKICASEAIDGHEYWNDLSWAEQCATDSDWVKQDDMHYCPDCYIYDDEDNLVIKHNYKQYQQNDNLRTT